MNNIALGRYLPLDSVIHRMDPRAKICAMLITMIAIFIPAGYSGYLVLGVIVCSIALMAKLQLSFVWRAMKPMLFMLVFLLVINLLVIHDGYVLLSIGSFHIYSGAVSQTLYIVVRLALMVVHHPDGDDQAAGSDAGHRRSAQAVSPHRCPGA